jgi:nucleoside triphosphatase
MARQICCPGWARGTGRTHRSYRHPGGKRGTGLDIYDIEFINFQEFIYDPSFWKPKHFIFFDYACKTASVNVQLNDEAEEYVWVPLEAAVQLPLDVYTRTSIEILRKRNDAK